MFANTQNSLLRRAQAGEPDALDALVQEYYPQILNYCRWHVPDEQQAQDAAQETFYKAVRWLDACGGFAGQFRPFLYKIAKNVCIDLHRASARGGPALESLPEEPSYQEAGFDQTEEALHLRALTAKLDPDLRELVLLLAGEVVLLVVLAVSVYAAAPFRLGQLVCLLAVPFLLANNELLLLLRRVRPERLVLTAVPLFAAQLCLLAAQRAQSGEPELPAGLPLAAGILAVCMGWQCAKLAARPEYAAEI